VANFATQYLSELNLKCEWILCSYNDFHAEYTQTGQTDEWRSWAMGKMRNCGMRKVKCGIKNAK